VQIAHRAVGPDDALLVVEVPARLDRGADAGLHFRAVVGMDERDEGIKRAAKGLGRGAVDLIEPVGPYDAVGHHVPGPAPEMGEPLGLAEVDVGVGQRGGALPHPRVEVSLRLPQVIVSAPPHRDAHAQHQARHRRTDHEG
jgi:hypothetical protein